MLNVHESRAELQGESHCSPNNSHPIFFRNFMLNENYKYVLLTHIKYVAENKMHFCDSAFENNGRARTNLN